MTGDNFPEGWNEERVKRVLEHYESQTDEEALAEDEAAWEETGGTMVFVPYELLPGVRALLDAYDAVKHSILARRAG